MLENVCKNSADHFPEEYLLSSNDIPSKPVLHTLCHTHKVQDMTSPRDTGAQIRGSEQIATESERTQGRASDLDPAYGSSSILGCQ
jgi:hypothetical protein